MTIDGVFTSFTSVIKGAVALGMSLVVLALVVDLLFPGSTGIVGKVSGLVTSFTSQGLVGLIALIIFVSLYSKD